MIPHFIILSLLLATLLGCSTTHAPQSQTTSTFRPSTTLASDWRFIRGDPANAHLPTFSTTDWHRVTVPHTFNVSDGLRANYYRGPTWYRRIITSLPNTPKDHRTYLRFGAASSQADVYLNGHKLGSHAGPFAAFTFDITDHLKAGENLLTVRVTNAPDPSIAPFEAPLETSFTLYGGLHRPVELFTTHPLAITPLDDGSCGVYLSPRIDAGGNGVVSTRVLVRNLGQDSPDIAVRCTLLDHAGEPVARSATLITAPSGTTTEATVELFVPRPRRWDGVRDPYLYTAVTETLRDGAVTDRVTQPLGFRTLSFTDGRPLLNEKPYNVHGVILSPGRPLTGLADTPSHRAEDFQLIAYLGATAVRLTQGQHAPDAYANADKLGLLVTAELPHLRNSNTSPGLQENAAQQLRELIKQNYNHPSIYGWILPSELALFSELAKELDSTRTIVDAADPGVMIPTQTLFDPTSSDAGLVTADRHTLKDAYFFHQANWSQTPVLHIASRNVTIRPRGPTVIQIYSNGQAPQLTLNGQALPLTAKPNCVYETTANLLPGKASLKATAIHGSRTLETAASWTAVEGVSSPPPSNGR